VKSLSSVPTYQVCLRLIKSLRHCNNQIYQVGGACCSVLQCVAVCCRVLQGLRDLISLKETYQSSLSSRRKCQVGTDESVGDKRRKSLTKCTHAYIYPTLCIMFKYSRAIPARLPFGSWYLNGTHRFRLTTLVFRQK